MKKILFIFTLLTCAIFAQAQNPIPADSTFPTPQSIANAPKTIGITNVMQAKKGFINGVYTDTTAANLYSTSATTGGYRLKYYPGAQIFTTSDNKFWVRNNTATKWISANSEGGGSVTQPNDSTLIICNAAGSCETIHLGNSDTYYFITIGDTSTAVVSCDTAVITCVGDSCYQTTLCDTTLIPGDVPFPVTVYQNGVGRLLDNNGIVEFGNPFAGEGGTKLNHNTYLFASPGYLNIQGKTIAHEGLISEQDMGVEESPSIMSWRHVGRFYNQSPVIDGSNSVSIYMNYTDPFWADTTGFMHNRIGYLLMGNARGNRYSFTLDNALSKQAGIMIHTLDTGYLDGVTIFAQQTPSSYPFYQNPMVDSTLLSKRVMVFKTNQDYQVPNYPDTRNDGVTGTAFFPDADGNVKLGRVAGGGSITFDNDTVFICSFGDNLCDTFITTLTDPIQYVTVINDTLLQVCDTNGVCQNIDVGGSSGGGVGVDEKFFTPNQIQATDTYHQMSKNFSLGINLVTSVSGVRNYNFLNSNTVSGSENVVWGRNMEVAGNTNFVAATDGFVFNTANYSATFGDAPINRGIAALTAGFGNKNWAENGFTMGSNNVNGSLSATVGTANLYSNSTVLGLQNFSLGNDNMVIGSFLTANNATGSITMFGKSYTVTTPNSFNVGYTTNAFEITANKVRINAARFEEYQGTSTAAANNLTLPNDGNLFTISGATQINAITTTNWQAGSKVSFIFSGAPLVKNNTAGGASTATILLAGRTDFQAAAGDVLYLEYDGTNWYEINRALASGGGSFITADNGITANTSTNVQLGGTLLKQTNIATGAFTLSITTSTGATDPFTVESTTGNAITATSSGNSAIYATGLVGGTFNSSGNSGITINATSGATPLKSFGDGGTNIYQQSTYSSTNSIETMHETVRSTTGTAANGIGSKFLFEIETDDGNYYESNSIISKLTNVVTAARTSQLDITGVNSAATTTIMSAYGSGVVGIGIDNTYTATRLNVVDNAVTSGNIVNITSTSTGAASNTQTVVKIDLSGANGTADQLTKGLHVSNTHTGSGTPTNYGIYGVASGATTNYGTIGQTTSSLGGQSAGVLAVNTSTGYGLWAQSTSNGIAINADGVSTGYGVYASASTSGVGVRGNSSTGYGVQSFSTSGVSLGSITTNASNSTVVTMQEFLRETTGGGGVGANGIGLSIDYKISSTTTSDVLAGQMQVLWTTATHASRASSTVFNNVFGAATVETLRLAGDGSIKLRPITATEASAIATAEGLLVMVSSTNGTFTSIGMWSFENGAWHKL